MSAPKFQPQPPRLQAFFDADKSVAKAWYQWFTLIVARLTSPVIASTPTSANDTGVAGQITYDANFLYVCVATNTWLRAPLSSF